MSTENDKKPNNFSTNLSSIVNDLKNLRNELSSDDASNDNNKKNISDALEEDLQNLSSESLENIDLGSLAIDINSDDIIVEDNLPISANNDNNLAKVEDDIDSKENIYLDVEKYAMDEIDNIDDFISDEEDSISQMIDNINLPNETENIKALLTGDEDMVLEDNNVYLVKEIELNDDDIFSLDVRSFGSFSSISLNDNM